LINEDREESLHESLVKCYVDTISAGEETEAARNSLNVFIRCDTTRLDLNTVLELFNSNGLVECLTLDFIPEQCVILGRLGRHDTAINIFLHTLDRRIDLAESYCNEHYNPSVSPSVYSILFAELFVYKEDGSITLNDILTFAVKHAQYLGIKEVSFHCFM
jgi:hypothetical protein